ncbi:MAG: ABC transporter ATP-binding protein [Bacillota bacterium]
MEAVVCSQTSKIFYERKVTRADRGGRRWWSFNHLRAKKTPVWAVRDVTFSVSEGEIFGILGANGSGKSTLIRLIATLLLPDRGTVSVYGHDAVADPMSVRRLINRVSVDAAFFKKLSAWENLSYASRLYGIGPRTGYTRARDILQSFGFDEDYLSRPVENLSRGMQQKVSIARALLTSPVLMLLDEPTTGLDPKSKADVQQFIREVHRESRPTILLTSHDMKEVETLCDRVAVMNAGRIAALDTVANLKRAHAVGPEGSLEDVFLAVTGENWEEAMTDE